MGAPAPAHPPGRPPRLALWPLWPGVTAPHLPRLGHIADSLPRRQVPTPALQPDSSSCHGEPPPLAATDVRPVSRCHPLSPPDQWPSPTAHAARARQWCRSRSAPARPARPDVPAERVGEWRGWRVNRRHAPRRRARARGGTRPNSTARLGGGGSAINRRRCALCVLPPGQGLVPQSRGMGPPRLPSDGRTANGPCLPPGSRVGRGTPTVPVRARRSGGAPGQPPWRSSASAAHHDGRLPPPPPGLHQVSVVTGGGES